MEQTHGLFGVLSHDIVPLFTDIDIQHMSELGVPLNDYQFMSQPDNANNVLQQVSSGQMPPDSPWPSSNIALFKAWIGGGWQP
jgi:hypothetical protein